MKKSIFNSRLLFLGLFIVTGLFIFGQAHLAHRHRTEQGMRLVNSVSAPVEIVRDNFGIAHIFADNEDDAFFALGYVMSEDRLFQMDLLRRASNGQLSEIIGPKMLEVDILARTFMFRETAKKLLSNNQHTFSVGALKAMDRFLEGLNYQMGAGKLPVEFSLLGYKPRPFTKVDILAISGQMSFTFTQALKSDFLFSELMRQHPDKAHLIGPLWGHWDEVAFAQQKGLHKATELPAISHYFSQTQSLMRQWTPGLIGSNAFALAPHRGQSGFAMLANDPHISFSRPDVWYEAHIKTPGFEIYGHHIPATPFAILGHTRHLGWGVTMSMIDDMDFYKEQFHPRYHNLVKYRNKYVDAKIQPQSIAVKGRPPYTFDLIVTPHGPLLNEYLKFKKKNFSSQDNEHKAFAGQQLSVSWAFHRPDNLLLETFYRLPRSKNFEEFNQSLALAKAPGLSIIYADSAGTIGHSILGHVGHFENPTVSGKRVLEGASGKDEYAPDGGEIQVTSVKNPPSGILIAANSSPRTGDFAQKKFYPRGYFASSDRYLRLKQLLESKKEWTLEDLKRVQTDDLDPDKKSIFPTIDRDLLNIERQYPALSSWVARLKSWDGQTQTGSGAALLYRHWMANLMENRLSLVLALEQIKTYCQLNSAWEFMRDLLPRDNHPFWEGKKVAIMAETLKESIEAISSSQGDEFEQWQWGRRHFLELKHPLGTVSLLRPLFNIGPRAVSGVRGALNNMKSYRCGHSHRVLSGPSTRRLIDFAHPQYSWGITPSGVSGKILNPLSSNQWPLFIAKKYRPQLMDKASIVKKMTSKLILRPQ